MRLLFFSVFLGDFLYLLVRPPFLIIPTYESFLKILLIILFFCVSMTALFLRRFLYVSGFLCALILGAWSAAHAWGARENQRIESMVDLKWRQIQGKVASIPMHSGYGWTWQVATSQLCDEEGCRSWRHELRMSDYSKNRPPEVGEVWQWSVRIKPPHSWVDPGLLAREQFDWYGGIDGNATVNRKVSPQRLHSTEGYYLERARAEIAKRILILTPDSPSRGLVLGLVLGIRDHITQTQWQLVRATGTSHLLAISGLHIALVAGIAFFFASWVWRRSAVLCCIIAAPRVAWIVAWVFAVIYSALAGFAIPTVRALIMLSVYMVTQMGIRTLPKGYGLLLALCIVILCDPLAPLSPSFILSFAAVAVLTIAVTPEWIENANWKRLLHTQWVATIGLLPVTLWLFQQFSIVGLIANLIAIPWVGWVSVPACFLAVMLLWIPNIAYWIFQFADYSLQILFWFFAKLSIMPHAVWHNVIPHASLMWIGSVCVLGLITQNKIRWLSLACVGLGISLVVIHPHPRRGEIWMTVLDVGQGLSVIVQTHEHVLVFDAGPKFPGGVDIGEKIVLPALAYYGWQHLDTLIVSHGDNDHYGGAASVLAHFPLTRLLTSVPDKFIQKAEYCHAGQQWQWDGVDFEILHPDAIQTFTGNNASCVLKIKNAHHQIILPGDIEKEGELFMVDHYSQQQLKSTVLVAAHHGSKTSSNRELLEKINPEWVVFSTGFLNRFHFPSKLIVERYQDNGTKMLNTANAGAIEFQFGEQVKIKKQRDMRCLFNLC